MAGAMFMGLLVCYAFGTGWFMLAYARTSGAIGLSAALSLCVLPFILPDCAKIALAIFVTKRLAKHIPLKGSGGLARAEA